MKKTRTRPSALRSGAVKNFRPQAGAAVLALCLLTTGCAAPVKADTCRVMVEAGAHYDVASPVRDIARGGSATFLITPDNGYFITDIECSAAYTMESSASSVQVTVENVRYPALIRVEVGSRAVTYDANGGTPLAGGSAVQTLPAPTSHLRANTARGAEMFAREGYVLRGWNTEADGTGTHIGIGSRTDYAEGLTLYAEWAEANAEADFIWEEQAGGACITGFTGEGGILTVPERLGGLPVRRIAPYAFAGCGAAEVILPSSLTSVQAHAFEGAALKRLTLYDGISEISDESFAECENLTTLHINAAEAPVYSGSYFDAFTDKTDRLRSLKGQKKLVLLAGSAARYAYDSALLAERFPAYAPVNMGVYAYTNLLPQAEIARAFMEEGDVLLSSPEFDSVDMQFGATNALDANIYAMVESDYDLFSLLDLRGYSEVFSSFTAFLRIKHSSEKLSYDITAKSFDDDGNPVPYDTYNEYGDYVLERPNEERDEMHRQIPADYTRASFPLQKIEALNALYGSFLRMGVRVYFTYAPRNRSSLTEESTPEEIAALDTYLREKLCAPVISDIQSSLFSGVYFYVIDNHLSSEGVALHMQNILEDLTAVL